MNYSVANLTQVADCNSLLAWAAREKADLNYKKITIERMSQKYSETSVGLDAEIQGVIAEIAAVEIIIAALPDGPSKEVAQDKKVTLEYRKFVLENRKENYGTVALLQKEAELGRIDQELAELEVFVTSLEARVVALAA